MRVLMLFGPDKFGGSFVIAEKISQLYLNEGHEVIMVLKDDYSIERYKKMGYTVVTIGSMKREIRLFSDICSSYKLMKLYNACKCDIIHSHTSKGGFYSRIARLFDKKIKIIHTVHGYYKTQNKFFDLIFDLIEHVLLSLSDAITFVNYEDYEKTQSDLTKLLYIPNGVDVNYYKSDRDFNEDIFKIIISARIVWEKGYKDVVELIQRFEKDSIMFHIVGTGINESEVKEMLLGYNNVIFHGFVTDVRAILSYVHMNLLPSYREGLSLSILEAMASGIPTIAYDIRGNRELIDNDSNGYICKMNNVDELEEKIRKYYSNRVICKMHGSNAYKKVKETYNARDTYKLYLEAITEIVNEA